jgi:hypothetical protein
MNSSNPSKNQGLPPSVYVNFLRVSHNPSEFYLAFGQVAADGSQGAHLLSSLITHPSHAKSMLRALREAVGRYEERFGEIPEPEVPPAPASGRKAPARKSEGSRSRAKSA